VFDIKTALMLPVFCYGKVVIVSAPKKCINFTCSVKPGILRLGGVRTYMTGYERSMPTYLNIRGKLKVGKHTFLGNGTNLAIADNATVKIGNNCLLNTRGKIYSEHYIELGDHVICGWETQIIDTNFHYLVRDGYIEKKAGEIIIGDNSWIGNRATVQKGTKLPPNSTVAAGSFVNKDFSNCPEGCVYGGMPAKKLCENTKPIVGVDEEYYIQELFNEGRKIVTEEEYRMRRSLQEGNRKRTLWGL
jgi:acetyltransferase-like isoleucine patch superfamily enzyme